ncbi:YopX family protein [Brevibacillus borstelensis]|uniref:YopX family protein n=1 Tax=Brevibacillus borstelensis TaxID=45462 RepID=UPI00287F9B08|nr:YopX family protein [Brevibacillus borstelensis]WNF07246.1 YopX family protein [Brevibacillus borstelensis]
MQAGREIKFRALGVDGDLHYFDIYDIVSPPDEDGVFYVRSNLGIPIAVEEGTEQQFTGLRDKNGKEIYEGDIVDLRDHPFEGSMKINGVYEVGYNERMELCCGSLLLHREIPYITVIGNIYENRDLLEVGE